MTDKMKSIRDRENSKIKEILTTSKYAIYEQEMEAIRHERRKRSGRAGHPRG